MKNLIYNAIKITISVVLAIFVAEILGLKYSTTAGVIAMLSILDSRRQSYVVGIKRIITATIAITLSGFLFYVGGHHLIYIGVFLIVFVPIVTLSHSTEGLTVSTVLVTHIYTLQAFNLEVIVNEMGLLLIGVLVAWGMNLHMPNMHKDITHIQGEVEKVMSAILEQMHLQLLNRCSIKQQQHTINQLDALLTEGLNKALIYNNNYMLKDYSYYIRYFQMRRQQFLVLQHMSNHFNRRIFIELDKAEPISMYTKKLATAFNASNDGTKALEEAAELMTYYRNLDLPLSREAFEDRATLFQYLTDMMYFVEIKVKFSAKFGVDTTL